MEVKLKLVDLCGRITSEPKLNRIQSKVELEK